MKFRCRLANTNVFETLAQTIDRQRCSSTGSSSDSPPVILKLTEKELHFIVASDMNRLQVFARIDNDVLFDQFVIQSAHENIIYLQLHTEHLLHALTSCLTTSDSDSMMKLTKRDGLPVLNFTTENRDGGRQFHIQQDVPVRVLSPIQAAEIKEPICPPSDINISLPPLSALKPLLDRMGRQPTSRLHLAANMSGSFNIAVKTDVLGVETFFKGLAHPELDPEVVDVENHPSMTRDAKEYANATIDMKDFIKFAQVALLKPTQVYCCIVQDKCVNIFAYIGVTGQHHVGSITYYIPVKSA